MTKILAFLFCFVAFSSFASVRLQVGDILLQPLKCWSCALIEAEEETIYSHVGIIIAVEPEILVAEALNHVRVLPLATFNARTRKDSKLSVRRLVGRNAVNFLQKHQMHFRQLYQNSFHGLKYDHRFLWNDVDEFGNETLYCSEFVTKLIYQFLGIELPVKRMHFEKNREQWIRFFKGTPPDGMIGNSPGDLERSNLLYEVGLI